MAEMLAEERARRPHVFTMPLAGPVGSHATVTRSNPFARACPIAQPEISLHVVTSGW